MFAFIVEAICNLCCGNRPRSLKETNLINKMINDIEDLTLYELDVLQGSLDMKRKTYKCC